MPLALNIRQCWGVRASQSGKRDMTSDGKQKRYQVLRQTPTMSEALPITPAQIASARYWSKGCRQREILVSCNSVIRARPVFGRSRSLP